MSNGKAKKTIKKTASAAAILKKRKAVATAKKLLKTGRKLQMTVSIDPFGGNVVLSSLLTLSLISPIDNITSIEQFLEDSMAEDFDVIGAEYEATMNAHAAKDAAFVHYIEGTMDLLSTPLAHEHIAVNFTRSGKHVTDVVQMGERMNTYKNCVDSHNNHLSGYWNDWEELQDEYMDLGLEVFGSDAFRYPPAGVKKFEAGFERKMELAYLEHQSMLKDVHKKLEALEVDFIKEIKAVEEVRELHPDTHQPANLRLGVRHQHEGEQGYVVPGSHVSMDSRHGGSHGVVFYFWACIPVFNWLCHHMLAVKHGYKIVRR
jgi:hypothetical protein